MAARRAVPDRTRNPSRLKGIADVQVDPAHEREDPCAVAPEIERYLGNAYLQAVAAKAASAGTGPGDADAVAEETRELSPPPLAVLQAKLALGTAGDAFEREADRIADLLMRRADVRSLAAASDAEAPPRAEEAPVRVSRQTPCDIDKGMDVAPDIAAQVARMRHGGSPLPARERALFEPLLGVDLGSIRIHTGIAAIQTARALNARAYTVGSDIAFASGQYRPGTDSGRRLLAHELVHTVQQQGGVGPVRRDVGPKAPPAYVDVTPATPEPKTAGTAKDEESFVPAALPIKQHMEAVATIDKDLITEYYNANGHRPPGEPGWLVLTPSGNIYAFVGDFPDLARPKRFRRKGGSAAPRLGYYLVLRKREWSDKTQKYEDYWDSLQYMATGRLKTVQFYEGGTSASGSTGYSLKTIQDTKWFEPTDLPVVRDLFRKATRFYWIVVPDPPEETRKEVEQERGLPPPEWVKKQQRSVKTKLKEAKAKGPDRDTPDRIEFWKKESTGEWWGIITVNFDAEGKDRSSVPIPLRDGEPTDDLMARIKGATQKAYVRRAGQRAEKLTEQAPKWARDLRKALWRELERLRKQEPGKDDFPDQLTLDVGRPGEATLQEAGALPPAAVALPRATPGAEAEAEVYLQVWVHVKGADDRLERLGGTAPSPLQPQMEPKDLVPPVRELAAKLRTKERKLTDPGGREGGTATRQAFRGEITPLDLSANAVTVTRANNKFKMDLKYNERYQDQVSLVLANMRTVYFKWEIYDAADILKTDDQLGKRLKRSRWPERANQLRKHLDADPRIIKKHQPVSSPDLDRLVQAKRLQRLQQIGAMPGAQLVQPSMRDDLALYDLRAADPRFVLDDVPRITFVKESRLRFPGAPGDYVVYCEATPEADKEKNAIWASSPAFYPVRAEKPEALGAEVVEMGPNLAKAIDQRIEVIKKQLNEDPSLDKRGREDLNRELRILSEQRRHLAAKERQDLAAATTSDIGQATDLLAKLEGLRKDLPDAIAKARDGGGRPIDFLPEDLKDLHYSLLREGTTVEDKIAEVKTQLGELTSLRTRIGKFADTFKSDSPYRYRPEVAFVSRIDGRVYPLIMMLSEISDRHSAKKAKERAKQAGVPYSPPTVAYSLVDLTTEQTKKEYVGFSRKDRDDPAAHKEAVIEAFKEFGREAVYGEGYLFVRIPPGPTGQRDDYHPGTDKRVSAFHPFDQIKQFESEKGTLEKAIEYLTIIAAVVGVAALVATGVGAPAAAALLGAIAAVLGAGLAVHNMRQRARSRTLEWDAALAIDVISIIALIPASTGLRMVAQSRNLARSAQALRGFSAPTWYQSFDRTQRLLRIYGWLENGAMVILLDRKLEDDIQRINAIPRLTDEQRRQLIDQAISSAAQTGLMMLGGWAASQAGAARSRPSYHEEREKLQRQAELLELEGMTHYPSLQERGWIDADGYWTAAGRQKIEGIVPGASEKLPTPPSAVAQPQPRPVFEGRARPPPPPPPRRAIAPSAPKRAIAPSAVEPPAGGRRPERRPTGEPEPDDTTQRRGEDFEEGPTREFERPEVIEMRKIEDLDMTVIKLSRPDKITPEYVYEVARLYHDTWQKAPDIEIGLYRNSETGDFIIVVGNDQRVYVERTGPGEKDVEPPIGKGRRQRWKEDILEKGEDVGEWINVAHSHPVDPVTGVVPYDGRFPSGADDDLGMLLWESSLLGGAPRTARIYFITPTGPDYTSFSYRPGAAKRIWIEYPDPNTGRRATLEFTDLDAYHTWMRDTHGIDKPPSKDMLRLEQELTQSAKREDKGSQADRRGQAPSAPRPPLESSPDAVTRSRDPEDPPGRIERSKRDDPDHYFAREYLGDVTRHDDVEIPEARYYVEAEFKDGIIEMDFWLRRNDIPGVKGFRRSSQLRGHEEFRRALDYFIEKHGEDGVQGIKGDWGGGDNLDDFNRAFHEGLINDLEWNEAIKYAAFRTHTGRWAEDAEFSEVRIQDDSGFNADKVAFDRIVVIFHKPGASGSGVDAGPGPAPPTTQGSPGPAAPGRQSSAGTVGAPEFARPAASRTGSAGPSRPPPTAQTRRGPPPGPPPPAGPGGGGGGRRGPGVRALSAREAAGIRPEVGLARTRRGDWAISWITSRDLYQAAWRDATGGQGDPAPPHGFLDRDHHQIVVFKPPANVNVIASPRVRQAPPTTTNGRATRPYPARAARELRARPPSPPPANAPVIRRQQPPRPAHPTPTIPRPAVSRRDPTEPPRRPRGVSDEVNRDREGNAPRIELEQSGRRREHGSPPPPARLPHHTDHPEVRGGWLDWLTRRRKLPKPQLGEQLSSGGDAGKLAYSGPGKFGVFEATLPGGGTVAVKIYPDKGGRGDANQRERFARDIAALEAASRTSSGPRLYGEVNVGPRRRGFAMERIEGDFPEAQPRTDRELTDSERFAERLARARITDRTLNDVERFGNELLGQGYYYDGEIQGLIDFRGRYRPIDFEKVRPLSRDPRIRAEQTRNHQERISNEIADLQSLRRPPEDRLPSDLPVPAALQGLGQQRFGTDVIAWGSGVQGTNGRLRAIHGNPQGERERLEANGLTLDMAKAWHVAYQHLDGQRHTSIFEARTKLLAEIVKLMTR